MIMKPSDLEMNHLVSFFAIILGPPMLALLFFVFHLFIQILGLYVLILSLIDLYLLNVQGSALREEMEAWGKSLNQSELALKIKGALDQ